MSFVKRSTAPVTQVYIPCSRGCGKKVLAQTRTCDSCRERHANGQGASQRPPRPRTGQPDPAPAE